ncbi:cytochrome oxidase putative small subunit CydP [Dokdonella sp.]|uniref:cytochrome oxidase putative small subunit CydP n=1 Tax=Dokdonella sp. TaxID=2291710 RepID=UPI00262059EC|nr:cytochrome oxidase putative small subunit CydP [Dokdonella sp.]
MDTSHHSTARSWFRTRGGRRFGIEFAAIVVVKLVALTLLWFLCIRPMPRADTAPAAIERHFLPAPPSAEVAHDR